MPLKHLLVFFCLACIGNLCSAQDIHYTQFFANPLAFNPAQAGNFNGGYRIGATARNQWRSVTIPYQTYNVYSDFALMQGVGGENDWIGGGLLLYGDRAGDGILTTASVIGQISFHKALNDNSYLSLGGGIGYTYKQIDFSQLYFNNQWEGDFFDFDLDNLEDFESDSFGDMDIQIGAGFSFFDEKRYHVNIGIAALHVNRPKESFYLPTNTSGNNRRSMRPVFTATADINFYRFRLGPGVAYTYDKNSQELMLGTNISFPLRSQFKSKVKWINGIWVRPVDAVSALTGFEFNRNRILLSYDINYSSLKVASNYRGAWEITIVKTGDWRRKSIKMKCPDF